MDFDDPHAFGLFLEIYGSLPRAGPGSAAVTRRALDLVPTTRIRSVLDLGCGPGAQTLTLAEALPEASIVALDLVPDMAAEAARRVRKAGLEARVRVQRGDMMSPPVPPKSQDLIWCEGAIYFQGIENALRGWRDLMTDSGTVAFTEPIWLTPSPPDELVDWWLAEYPSITDANGVRSAVASAEFSTVGHFVLPTESWWTDFYRPMESRIAGFRADHVGDPVAEAIAAEAEHEIDMFRRYSDHYSYGFFVVRPRTGRSHDRSEVK
jgi:SAM-dependent methyltransferase